MTLNARIGRMLATAVKPGEDELEITTRMPWLYAIMWPWMTLIYLGEAIVVVGYLLADDDRNA